MQGPREPDASQEDASEEVVPRAVIDDALTMVTPEHREVIVEVYLKGRSYAEVSAEIGVPTETLRSRNFYALKALRLAMDEIGATS